MSHRLEVHCMTRDTSPWVGACQEGRMLKWPETISLSAAAVPLFCDLTSIKDVRVTGVTLVFRRIASPRKSKTVLAIELI